MDLFVDIRKRRGSFYLDTRFETDDMVTGFLGASGCGKSTTLKCIAGIETPDEGRIVLNGRILFDSDLRINLKPGERRVGYQFQNYALFPSMNVMKNITAGLRRSDSRLARYPEMIRLFRLEGLETLMPRDLSGGQAQRVALARAVIRDPELLLFDEPFSALDSFLRKTVQDELEALLRALDKPALIVTHSQREVRRLTTRLFLMDSGRIIQGGPTCEVFSNPVNSAARILLEE